MNKRIVRQNVLPAITALIWGSSYVALSAAAEYLPTFAFTGARSAVAAVFLLAVSVLRNTARKTEKTDIKKLAVGGILCGIFLTAGSVLQQAGVSETSAGKAGFITALYIVIVPLFLFILGEKPGKQVWLGVALALAGLYLLCVDGKLSLSKGDIYLLGCAFFFAGQILTVDRFAPTVDPFALSCAEFAVMAVLCFTVSALTETVEVNDFIQCIWPILYVGLLSSGVAFTFQVIAQKETDTNIVTLWFSLESVFAALSGAVLLNERLSIREYIGCALMLLAIITAQIKFKK